MVYEACVEDIVMSVLEGYNGSIIAYGQTGTGQFIIMQNSQEMLPLWNVGKSYTIEGTMEEQRGIVPRTAEAIFHCTLTK